MSNDQGIIRQQLTKKMRAQIQDMLVFPIWVITSKSFYAFIKVDGGIDFDKLAHEWGETISVHKTRCPLRHGTFRAEQTYHEYIKSASWREKAMAAKERAGWRCQVCNKHKRETTLDAHHRTYERLGYELPEDITVLCRDCHELYELNKHDGTNGKSQEGLRHTIPEEYINIVKR